MIWAIVLFGELVLCLAEPKSFVYVSEIEDDDYPPPIDFRYYDRQRYIPPYLQRHSVRSKQNVNPTLVKDDNRKANPSYRTAPDHSTSARADKELPSAISNPHNTDSSLSNGPSRYISSSLSKTNPRVQTSGPSSHISFNPPGANSKPGGEGPPVTNRGTNQNVSPQNNYSGSRSQGQLGNPAPLSPYSNGGNTGVLPPSSVLRGRSASPPQNGGPIRPPTFAYSSPQAPPQNFHTSLRAFDLSSDGDPQGGKQRGSNSHLSEEEESSNRLKPTDIINKLPACPFPTEKKDERKPSNYANSPPSRFTSSFPRSVTYGIGRTAGLVATSVIRSPIAYAINASFNAGKDASGQHYDRFPGGNARTKPAIASSQYHKEGNPLYRGLDYNSNIPKQAPNNAGSSSFGNSPQKNTFLDSQGPDSNVGHGGPYGNRGNQQENPLARNFGDNSESYLAKPRDGGSGYNGQAGVNLGNTNINSNRQRSVNAPVGVRATQYNNKILANRPQISSNIGSTSQQRSPTSGNQNIGKEIRTDQEYIIYRPPSYETVRAPQPHEKYPAVGVKENFGPANIAIAPLPPDVDGDEIPGQAWVDYPLYHSIPETSFSCTNYPLNGYYADLEGSCQVYHFCQPGGVQTTFLCPNGTIFSQKKFACQWWYKTNCTESPHYFSLNSNLYKIPIKVDTKP